MCNTVHNKNFIANTLTKFFATQFLAPRFTAAPSKLMHTRFSLLSVILSRSMPHLDTLLIIAATTPSALAFSRFSILATAVWAQMYLDAHTSVRWPLGLRRMNQSWSHLSLKKNLHIAGGSPRHRYGFYKVNTSISSSKVNA